MARRIHRNGSGRTDSLGTSRQRSGELHYLCIGLAFEDSVDIASILLNKVGQLH